MLISSVSASDDELFIVQGDDELMFAGVLDDESGFFSGTQQNQQSGSGAQSAAPSGNSGTGRDNPEEILTRETESSNTEETIIGENQEDISLLGRENLFDINIKIDQRSKNVKQNEDVLAVVSLLNLGNPGRINTSIHYWIEGEDLLYEEYENISVETQKEFIKRFNVGKNMPPKTYTLNAELSYEGQLEPAYSSDTFQVFEKKFNYLYVLLIFAVLLLILFAKRKFLVIKRQKHGKF